jgi:PAS domain S-box-containing protein
MAAVWRERNDLVFRLREAAAGLEDMVARRSDELRKSELRLRQAIDVAGLGVFEHDYDNDVVFVSPRMQELAGRHGDGPLALAESLDAVHPDDRARVIASIERSMHPETGGTDTEYRVQWPDGTVRWHRSRAQTFFEGSRPRRTVGVVMDITPQKVEQLAWRETHEGLEKRIESRTAALAEARLASQAALVDAPVSSHGEPAVGRLIEAQDAERRRLSREVHDQLGGHVATLGILASAVQGHAHGGEASAAASALAEAVAHLGEDVGRLARELRPAIVDSLGLAAALRHQVEEWGRRTSVPVAFEAIGGDGAGAPVDVEATLYRVTQEALTNVARHAAATRVAVVLTVRNGQLSLVVEDDGCGFCPGEAASTGLGLVGMRERLALVRGTLQVESAPGRGTTVHARVPVSLDRNPGPELRV